MCLKGCFPAPWISERQREQYLLSCRHPPQAPLTTTQICFLWCRTRDHMRRWGLLSTLPSVIVPVHFKNFSFFLKESSSTHLCVLDLEDPVTCHRHLHTCAYTVVLTIPNKNGTAQLIAAVENWSTVTYNNCTFVGLANRVFKQSRMLGNSSKKLREALPKLSSLTPCIHKAGLQNHNTHPNSAGTCLFCRHAWETIGPS